MTKPLSNDLRSRAVALAKDWPRDQAPLGLKAAGLGPPGIDHSRK